MPPPPPPPGSSSGFLLRACVCRRERRCSCWKEEAEGKRRRQPPDARAESGIAGEAEEGLATLFPPLSLRGASSLTSPGFLSIAGGPPTHPSPSPLEPEEKGGGQGWVERSFKGRTLKGGAESCVLKTLPFSLGKGSKQARGQPAREQEDQSAFGKGRRRQGATGSRCCELIRRSGESCCCCKALLGRGEQKQTYRGEKERGSLDVLLWIFFPPSRPQIFLLPSKRPDLNYSLLFF